MTSIETGRTWSDRLNPRNWTLVWKLAVVGLLPAILALTLGVLRVADQAGEAGDLGRSTRLLEVQEQVADAADALRQERDEATLFVAGNRLGDRGVLDIGIGEANGEIDEMLNTVRGTSELDPTTLSALQQAEAGLEQLPLLRTDATENAAAGANSVRGRYTDAIKGIDVLDRALLRQLRTPGVAGLADSLTAVTSATEQLAVQHTVIGAAIRAGRVQTGDVTAVNATDNQLSADAREYQVALTPDQLTEFGNFLEDAANSQRDRLKAAILATPVDRPVDIQAFEWDTAYNGSRAAAERSSDLLRGALVSTSAAAEEAASNEAGIQSVLLMLGLLSGITVAVLVARGLIRSLRVLRTTALDVAERRLPQAVESMRAGESPDVTVEPVPLTNRDEVGQVARAFDAVHGQAVRLAADQAALQSNVSAMFVNLSRRSQALVERQLQLIEQLESNEQDPDQLSNLFQLDHLATRMRRNSENLLVLAGTDLAKRNIAPIPMVDVLRAAVSEVEQYQRVVVQSPPTATIVGRAGADLVHLLAELLDNATNFSPPDSQVVMSSTRTSDGSIVVEIADRGVGMADHELGDANQRLSGPSTVDVSASRRMGLFVVGRLGARHGISVRLSSSSSGQGAGLTASVTVPAYLIPSGDPATAGRQLGAPHPAGVGAGGNDSTQRIGTNGTRNGTLSALIAGADGPANPTGVFDLPAGQDVRDQPRGGSLGPNTPPALPTRRPGSTLRPDGDGPPLPPRRDPAEQAAADQASAERAAEDKAREVAEQARRDQERAARRAAADRRNTDERQATQGGFDDSLDSTQTQGTELPRRNGSRTRGPGPNGSLPQVPPSSGAAARGVGPNGAGPQGGPPRGPAPDPAAPDEAAAQPGPPAPMQATGATGAPSPMHLDDQQPTVRTEQVGESAQGDTPAGRPGDSGPGDRPFGGGPLPKRGAPVPPPAPVADLGGRPDEVLPQRRPAQRSEQPAPLHQGPPQQAPPQHGPAQQAPPQHGPAQQAPPQHGPAQQAPSQQGPSPQGPPQQGPPPRQGAGPRAFSPLRSGQRPEAAHPSAPAAPAQDELFAPSVPALSEPEPALSGKRPGQGPAHVERSDANETTPIFEEIASAWFRSNRPVPVTYEAENGGPQASGSARSAASAPPAAAPPAAAPPAAGPPAAGLPAHGLPASAPPASVPPASRPAAPAPLASPRPTPLPPPRPVEPVPAPEPERVSALTGHAGEQGFASQADEGWRAANGAVVDRSDGTTAAGLPKRRPKARLVPGSAGAAVLAPAPSATRSAESIRGRLASYQQGVRQGRESRLRGESGSAAGPHGGNEPANAGGNHDEESS